MEIFNKKVDSIFNLYKLGNFSEAEVSCKDALNTYPKAIVLHNIYGIILMNQRKINDAIKCFKDALIINPKYAPIYDNLGTAYKEKEDFRSSLFYYNKAIELDNKSATTYNNIGNLFHTQNDNKKAIINYVKATEINPNFYIAHYNAGVVLKNLGEFQKATLHLNSAIKININFFTAHRIISQITKYSIDNKHLNVLNKLYKDEKIPLKNKTELLFALGKAYEDLKNYEESYNYYSQGNTYRRNEILFSIKNEKKDFIKIKKIFNKKFFKKFSKSLNKDKTPIFIIGMPRSGTTLVEQIISSHPKVFGGDELNFLPTLIEDKFKSSKNNISFNKIKNISKNDILNLSNLYINRIRTLSTTAEKITDKLPINFKWVGLIKIAFPNATIIHCKRNAEDNCFSIYKNYFTNPKLNFAYKIDEIVNFYNLYSNLMFYWKKNIPNYIYDIHYEKLINNPKKEIQNLIKACNLSWNNSCIEFYKNTRPIKTTSDTQVRKKIYNTSINAWKNYRKYFAKYFKKII